jgi:hypothetical protein
MRDMGVATFKSGDLEISLGTAPAQAHAEPDPDAPKVAPKKSSYDKLLFACTEGLPEDDE